MRRRGRRGRVVDGPIDERAGAELSGLLPLPGGAEATGKVRGAVHAPGRGAGHRRPGRARTQHARRLLQGHVRVPRTRGPRTLMQSLGSVSLVSFWTDGRMDRCNPLFAPLRSAQVEGPAEEGAQEAQQLARLRVQRVRVVRQHRHLVVAGAYQVLPLPSFFTQFFKSSFTQLYPIVPIFTLFYPVLSKYTNFYSIILTYTYFYSVLLRFTIFYLVFPGFT